MTRHHRCFSALPRAISPQGVAIYFIAGPCGEMAIKGGFSGGGDTGGIAPHGGGGRGFAVAYCGFAIAHPTFGRVCYGATTYRSPEVRGLLCSRGTRSERDFGGRGHGGQSPPRGRWREFAEERYLPLSPLPKTIIIIIAGDNIQRLSEILGQRGLLRGVWAA